MTLPLLPQTHYGCLDLIHEFTMVARRNDPEGFKKCSEADDREAEREAGVVPNLYDWMQWRLKQGLREWRKPGQAAWTWRKFRLLHRSFRR